MRLFDGNEEYLSAVRDGFYGIICGERTQTWRQNAGTAEAQVTDTDVHTVQDGFTNTATTKNIANGAGVPATAMDVRMVQTGCTGMVRAATSASGAVQRPMARAVRILRRGDTRSREL